MKKLLLLAGILVVGATSFGYHGNPGYPGHPGFGHGHDGSKNEAILEVSAEVVKKIEIKTSEVKFGKVAAGMRNLDPKQNGEIKLDGEANAFVAIKLLDKTGRPIGLNGYDRVYLSKEGDNSAKPLEYVPKAEGIYGNMTRLNEVGKKVIPVEGKLNVPRDAVAGIYSTDLTVKAQYSMFANN